MSRFELFVRVTVLVAVAFFASSTSGLCQSNFGSIVGTAADRSGGTLKSLTVTVTNDATGEVRTTPTSSSGSYQFLSLAPGTYKLDIEGSGFKHYTRRAVEVLVGQASRADVTMEVGSVTEAVTVTAQPPLLQTENASLGEAITGNLVTSLPLNGRNVLNLAALVPGVIPGGSTAGNLTGQNVFAAGNYQIGGGTLNQSATLIDGAPVNISYGNLVPLVPDQDTVQEFRVQTNNNTAEYGMFAGGVINLSTKSGSNLLHGTVYEYVRNTVFNAGSFFGNRNGTGRPAFHQNQFGATVGGRVIKDKWFFFGGYEGFRQIQAITVIGTVPTAAELSGDFSNYRNAAGAVIPIYDPLTTCGYNGNPACAPGATVLRQQFPNNIIPANRLNQVALNLINLPEFAKPTSAGQANTQTSNFARNAKQGGTNNQYNVRSDQQLGQKQQLFERYTLWQSSNVGADPYGNGLLYPQGNPPEQFTTHQGVVGDTYVFSPTMIADLRVSYLHYHYLRDPGYLGTSPSKFGFPSYFDKIPAYSGFNPSVSVPYVSASGYSTGGGGIGLYTGTNTNFAIAPSVSKQFHKNTLQAGVDIRRLTWGYFQNSAPGGQFNFDNIFTSQNALNPGASGNSIASFLLGYAASGTVTPVPYTTADFIYQGYFVNDTWQISNKATLVAGLRYEIPGVYKENNDLWAAFNPAEINPATAGITVNGQAVMGAYDLVNSKQHPTRRFRDEHYTDFSPRLGLSYRLSPDTVVRSGYGVFFIPVDVQDSEGPWANPINLVTNTMVTTTNSSQTPFNTLSDPFPGGFVAPPGRSSNYQQTLLGGTQRAFLGHEANGVTYQWNLTVQHQFTQPGIKNLALEVAYVGLHGQHLPQSHQINQLPDADLALGSQLLTQVANPFYGIITAGSLAQPTVQYEQLLRPFPEYGNLNNSAAYGGESNYEALQVKAEKRLQASGEILVSYTHGKLLTNAETLTNWLDSTAGYQDTNNIGGEYSESVSDIRDRISIAYRYALPFGRDRASLRSANPTVNALVGGWGFDGITTFQSGAPLFLSASPNLTQSLGGGLRPNVVPGCNKSIPGPIQQKLTQYFNYACFTVPAPYSFGNEPRVDSSLLGPGVANFDFALFKDTPLKDRVGLQFRAEAFNLFNRVQFGNPNTGVTTAANPTTGQITTQANMNRVLQLALRLSY